MVQQLTAAHQLYSNISTSNRIQRIHHPHTEALSHSLTLSLSLSDCSEACQRRRRRLEIHLVYITLRLHQLLCSIFGTYTVIDDLRRRVVTATEGIT